MIEQAATQMAKNHSTGAVGRIGVVAACGLMVSVLLPSAAAAVTLTNNDATTYKVEVMAKSMRREHELAPGKSLTGLCLDGCVIRLNGIADADYELEGTERVSIEGGLVYYDGEEAKPKASEAADGATPSEASDAPGGGDGAEQ